MFSTIGGQQEVVRSVARIPRYDRNGENGETSCSARLQALSQLRSFLQTISTGLALDSAPCMS